MKISKSIDQRINQIEQQLSAALTLPHQIELTTQLAHLLFQKGELQQAEQICEQIFTLAQQVDADGNSHRELTGGALVIQGKIFLDAGELLQAQSIFRQALQILSEDHPDIYYINCLTGLSWIQMMSNNLPEARLLVDKALHVAETMQDEPMALMVCYNMLAFVMDETGFFEPALEYYQKARDIAGEMGDLRAEVLSFNNSIMTLLTFNHADQALALLPELEGLANRMGNVYMHFVEDTFGQVYLAAKDYARAITYFKDVIQKCSSNGHEKRAVESYFNLSKALCETGDFEAGVNYGIDGLRIAEELGMVSVICESHGLLAQIYEQKGDYRLALEHHKQHHEMRETKYSRDTLQKISDLTASFQAEASHKDAEILRLKNIALIQELEEHRRGFQELEKLASTDPLTGLLNRRSFFSIVQQHYDLARQFDRPLSMAILDLDLFKQINDQYGHLVGDQALVEFAKLIFRRIRKLDVCCRFGGDEFLVLMPDTALEEAELVTERIRSDLDGSILSLGMHHLKLTLSAGITTLLAEDTLESLVDRADKALYITKNGGRNGLSRL